MYAIETGFYAIPIYSETKRNSGETTKCVGGTDSGKTTKRGAVAEIYRAPPYHGERALMSFICENMFW